MSITALAVEDSLLSVFVRFGINLAVIFILIRMIYYRFSQKEENMFSFFMMGIVIFLLVSLLERVEVQIGIALGLFALFAIIRFRTVNMSAKDMTYFFTTIGISIINSQADLQPPVLGALLVNSVILTTALILEIFVQDKTLNSFTLTFNNHELLKPELRKDLLNDLSLKTGHKIEKVKIEKMNIDKGSAELTVWFKEKTK
ncbi:MAG TPA: DUF4956 domain-containing protein [Bacteroidales bacterium]|nr:DUF4956 domain-containing protein [Bacteroidales bacterium]HPR73532.1 DUF4956 domain-containing protein [Bacteroidales bacterium]